MIYLYSTTDTEQIADLLREALPSFEVAAWPTAVVSRQVRYAVVWNPPENFFDGFSKLEAVFVLGAGVDRLIKNRELPEHVAIVRLLDAGMAQQMFEYVLYGVLRYQRQFDTYQKSQVKKLWEPLPPRSADEVRITVLGLGAIGAVVAKSLAGFGYKVAGWSRSPHCLPGVSCHHGNDVLPNLLANTDALVNILPSTNETNGLLDHKKLSLLPYGSAVINASRGDQLNLDALIEELSSGRIRFAQLDVFETEPLQPTHPLWERTDVTVTPHIAAITLPKPAVKQISESISALLRGDKPAGLVERRRSY